MRFMYPCPPSHAYRPDQSDHPDLTITPDAAQTIRINLNKQHHQIEYEHETETHVTVVIKPKGGPDVS